MYKKGAPDMPIKKKAYSAEFKFKVALEALRGDKTSAELCQKYGIVSSQLFKWKKALIDRGADVFRQGSTSRAETFPQEIDKLHATIGRLKVENDFLERVLGKCR